MKDSTLPIGSLVWYITHESLSKKRCRFEWYVPAIVKSHIHMKGKGMIKYKLEVDCSSERLPRYDGKEVKRMNRRLRKVDAGQVEPRWDEQDIPCPIEGFDEMNRHEDIDDHMPDFDYLDDKFNLKGKVKKDADGGLLEAQEKYGMDLGFQGAKQNGHGPEMWGITLQQLRDVMKDEAFISGASGFGGLSGGMTMYEVVEKIIKPKTKGRGMGYSLLVNDKKPLRAKVMVSHAWGEDYERFISALQDSGCSGPFWVCAMSIYQNGDIPKLTIAKQLGPNPSTGPFSTVLKQSTMMLAVVTPDCDIYTRLWCVYEMFVAIHLGVKVEVTFFSQSTGYGGSDKYYSNVGIDSANAIVNTRDAECSSPTDQELISNQVSGYEGGFDLLDDVIYWVKLKALIGSRIPAETMMPVPFGTCTSSNAAARRNIAVQKLHSNWKLSKHRRKTGIKKKVSKLESPIRSESSEYLEDEGHMFISRIFCC